MNLTQRKTACPLIHTKLPPAMQEPIELIANTEIYMSTGVSMLEVHCQISILGMKTRRVGI